MFGEIPKLKLRPPPNAISDMLNASSILAKSCKELVDLENILGYFPLLDKPLDFKFEEVEERDKSTAPQDPSKIRLALLSYDEYNRENQLKQIEELSSKNESNDQLDRDQTSRQNFLSELDSQLATLVASVAFVKQVHEKHLKDEFVGAISTVVACTQSIIYEIQSYEPFSEASDSNLVMDVDEVDNVEEKAGSLGYEDDQIPVPYKSVLIKLQNEILLSTRLALFKGKVASASVPPPNSATEMIQATVPCLLGVRKLVAVAKEGALKWAKT